MNGKRGWRIRIEPGDLIVEVISVTLAILLALAIGQWQSHLHDVQLLRDSAANIVAELDSNGQRLARIHPRHLRLMRSFRELDARVGSSHRVTMQQLSDAIARGAPEGTGLMIPQSSAWQIAQTNQGLTLLPYAGRARLTGIYGLQDFYFASEQKYVDSLLAVSIPPEGNFYLVFENAESRLGDLLSLESELSGQYAAAAKDLRPRI